MTEVVTKVDFKSPEDNIEAIRVDKLLELNIDAGTLLALDTNDINKSALRGNKNEYLKNLARDNTQLLLNAIWKLPTERVEDAIVAKLPQPTFVLPREKPIPKPKSLTKWQQFAKDKGLKKTKKGNLTWDEVLKKWVPRHGYKRAAADREKDWVVEIPDQADPYVDYFQKKADEKKERVSKNEFQRLRNIAKSKNVKVPSMGLPPTEKLSSVQLNAAAHIANVSTASVGKFQPRLSKEKTLSRATILPKTKRKFPLLTEDQERKSNMDIANVILNKRPKLDIDKAVNREIHTQETQASERKKSTKGGSGKRGGGNRKRGKSDFKKPTGGKGARNFKGGRVAGRKRR